MDKEKELVTSYERDKSKDYLIVLRALKDIPFFVGKNLLIDFLKGNMKNKSIQKNRLHSLSNFGMLNEPEEYIAKIIDNLISNKFIETTKSQRNQFLRIIGITTKGELEIKNPRFHERKINNYIENYITIITEKEIKIFDELKDFLKRYDDFQKKAIVSENSRILCIAGAGTGKTTVLTKRIEFLVKYKSTKPEKILAITFTRKAREEMQRRLNELNINNVNVETFNSFSEKILKKHQKEIYGRAMNVINYSNKAMAISLALNKSGFKLSEAIELYFSENQKRNKTKEELSNIFMNDCFFIVDYLKIKDKEFYDFSVEVDFKNKKSAKMLYEVCKYLKEYMKFNGLRDYTDQMIDAINFFRKSKEYIPEFEHILVDEYQDVNKIQVDILDLLKPKNLFCVGDPRQSIFGWRGSDIKNILKFKNKYPESDIIILATNYRSSEYLIKFMNTLIKDMNLPDLRSSLVYEKNIKLIEFSSEEREYDFVIKKILNSNTPREEIFVLSRTNRQLREISNLLKQKNIHHILKTEEINSDLIAKKGEITLATIHSIKGLEARTVFITGCTESNFPCKSSDHPLVEMIKIEEYDKEEEEKRLLYVGISRAKENLYLTYSGKKPTYFITNKILEIINNTEL